MYKRIITVILLFLFINLSSACTLSDSSKINPGTGLPYQGCCLFEGGEYCCPDSDNDDVPGCVVDDYCCTNPGIDPGTGLPGCTEQYLCGSHTTPDCNDGDPILGRDCFNTNIESIDFVYNDSRFGNDNWMAKYSGPMIGKYNLFSWINLVIHWSGEYTSNSPIGGMFTVINSSGNEVSYAEMDLTMYNTRTREDGKSTLVSIPGDFSASRPYWDVREDIVRTIDIQGYIKYTILYAPNSTGKYQKNLTIEIPMTNCAYIGGNGSTILVGMRGNSTSLNINNFVNNITRIKDFEIGGIDPFKKYPNKFSFYLDLTNYNDHLFEDESKGIIDPTKSTNIHYSNSCFKEGLEPSYSIFYTRIMPSGFLGYTFGVYYPIVFIKPTEKVFIHEFGHAYCGLDDEYYISDEKIYRNEYSKNCALNAPELRYSYGGQIYGNVNLIGCGYEYHISNGFKLYYYRPSDASIMGSANTWDYSNSKFNVVSCGYCVARLKGSAYGQQYYPICNTYNTIKKT